MAAAVAAAAMVVAVVIGAAAVVIAAVVMTAAATSVHGLKFLGGGVADSKNLTVEAHSLSGLSSSARAHPL